MDILREFTYGNLLIKYYVKISISALRTYVGMNNCKWFLGIEKIANTIQKASPHNFLNCSTSTVREILNWIQSKKLLPHPLTNCLRALQPLNKIPLRDCNFLL